MRLPSMKLPVATLLQSSCQPAPNPQPSDNNNNNNNNNNTALYLHVYYQPSDRRSMYWLATL